MRELMRRFIDSAVRRTADKLAGQPVSYTTTTRWQQDADGHFRLRQSRRRFIWLALLPTDLGALPDYGRIVAALHGDAVIAPHMNRAAASVLRSVRIEPALVMTFLISRMLDDEGGFAFSDDRFDEAWTELIAFLQKRQFEITLVAPIPHLTLPQYPVRLNKELVLDRLTSEEVTRCHQVGVLAPRQDVPPIISSDDAVGLRRTVLVEREPPPAAGAPRARFGSQPVLAGDQAVADVLLALQLFKPAPLRATGHVTWTNALWLSDGTTFGVFPPRPGAACELTEADLPALVVLWGQLEQGGARRFEFGLSRFMKSIDHDDPADRVVDLILAAEALFLADDDPRSDAGYRCCLRAAKFVRHPSHSPREIFQLMRDIYSSRNAIMYGRETSTLRLPGVAPAILPALAAALEDVVRLGYLKALGMKDDGSRLGDASFWDELMFA
jgi:hypothetical protein